MIDISGQLLKTFLNPIFIFVSSNHMQGLLMGFKLEKQNSDRNRRFGWNFMSKSSDTYLGIHL